MDFTENQQAKESTTTFASNNKVGNCCYDQILAPYINLEALRVHTSHWHVTYSAQDSSYGFGGLFKNLIKSVAKKAAKAGAKQLAKNVKKIVKEKFQERRNRTATYEMEDRIPRLSQLYLSVAEDVENMGKALETLGVEAAVGKEVTV